MRTEILPADPTNAPLLAKIHTTAFSTNRLMRAIYPTTTIWTAFQSAVEKNMGLDILDERTSVVVARCSSQGDGGGEEGQGASGPEGGIVGFAVWVYCPGGDGDGDGEKGIGKADGVGDGKGRREGRGLEEAYRAPQWNLPEGTDYGVLTPWKETAAKVAESVVGDREHYELTWLAISPTHTRLGIGTQLLNWGLALCSARRIPAYLDSTVEAAETFYAKAGFEEKGRIRMVVQGEVYEEIACLFEAGVGGGDTATSHGNY